MIFEESVLAKFVVRGLRLEIPDALIDRTLRDALVSERYEWQEARALQRHLQPSDRVLELGAGCGLLAAVAAGIVGSESVVTVEPNPDMGPVVARTMTLNGLDPVTVLPVAVVAGGTGEPVTFFVRRAFWSASLDERRVPSERAIRVPTRGLAELLAEHRPTVLIVDTEGGELDLFPTPLDSELRLIIVELHPKRYGSAGVKRIFDALSEMGFAYCPPGSQGYVVVFERVEP